MEPTLLFNYNRNSKNWQYLFEAQVYNDGEKL